MTTRNNTPWTATEDKTLRELAGLQSYETIGLAIGRSRSAVHARAKRLGITDNARRGEHHHKAKLTNLQAAMLGALLDAGFSAPEIKRALPDLPVAAQTIGDIGRGTSWGHIAR